MVYSFVVVPSEGTRHMDQVFVTTFKLCTHSKFHFVGFITLGDILEILPFEDPIVVLELDGQTIWDALESSLATWPAQEGCV